MSDRRSSLAQLTLVRYREFIREPEAVFWVFVFPILLAAGLGIAFRNRPQDVQHVAVVRTAPGADSVARALGADARLRVRLLDDSAATRALRTGEVAVVVRPGAQGVTLRYDDTRADARTTRLLVGDVLQRAGGRRDVVDVREDRVRERGSRYIDFVIPGLLGMNIMGSGIWGVGFAIVDARRKRLLKRLVATPMSRSEYLASFILSRLTLLVIEVATLLGFGVWVFDVPVRGALGTLALISVVSAFGFTALGLLVASRARTIEGASGLMNLVMMPMWVFSGVFFSAANFPAFMQPFIQALPLTAAVDGLRSVMLQGATLHAVAGELGILVLWTVVCFVLALRLFRWT
ncbi:MAG TPA: ABC transporter permease [Gemmatimonadaceae bacterium]|nr:ABC transporter permease [Gemmatimonadaceae bacterium]